LDLGKIAIKAKEPELFKEHERDTATSECREAREICVGEPHCRSLAVYKVMESSSTGISEILDNAKQKDTHAKEYAEHYPNNCIFTQTSQTGKKLNAADSDKSRQSSSCQ
jgi:hypothetical protein